MKKGDVPINDFVLQYISLYKWFFLVRFLLESVGIEGSQVHLCAMLFLQSPVQFFKALGTWGLFLLGICAFPASVILNVKK